MENNDTGESSCKKHSHSDSTSNGRPLKKAKFPWQVKGKYHLKEQDEAMDEDPAQPEDIIVDQSDNDEKANADKSHLVEKKFENKVEENLEMLGDYLLKQDFSSLNTLLFGPEAENRPTARKAPENSTSADQSASTTYPKYTPSYKRVPNSNNNNDSSISSNNLDLSDSSSDVDSNNIQTAASIRQRSSRIEDQYLKRWQARQIAKGYVDNTINRVLDSWFISPLPPYLDENRQLTLDVTGLLDDLAGDDGIENEGILMAISAHGLQNNQTNARTRDLRTGLDSNGYGRNHMIFRNRNTIASTTTSNEDSISETLVNTFESCIQSRTKSRDSSPNVAESSQNLRDDVNTNSNSKSKSESANANPSSSPEPPAWRHLSETCNCSNTHRRNNTANMPTIPFHRRNQSDGPSRMVLDSLSHVDEPMVSASAKQKESDETSPSQSNDSSSGSSNNNESTSTSTSVQNNFSIPNNASDDQYGEHFDFLDAAVSYAIQAKGLIPF